LHSNLGNALRKKGDLPGAIAAHREAVRLDPNLAGAHFNLGNALKDNNDIEQAIAEYREALRLDPDLAAQPEVCFVLGTALESKGDKQGALEQFRLACTKAPNNAVFCEKYRRVAVEFTRPKIDGTAQIKMKSGQYLKGTVRGMIVQMCGSTPAGKRISSLTMRGEMSGYLRDDSPFSYLQTQGITIRLCNGKSVKSIDEQGLATEPDESLFFRLLDLKGPVTATVALNGLRPLWGRTYSVEKRSFISSMVEEGGAVLAFAASAATLDQSRCSIEGTIKQEDDGTVKSPAKILPTIELRTDKGLQIVPVKEIAVRGKDMVPYR
jgi:hypothetical protein